MSAPSPLPPDLWGKTPADVQAAVLALVRSFESRIAGLEARLKRSSSNSSKPSSSEPLRLMTVRVKLVADPPGRRARRLVAREEVRIEQADGWASFEVPALLDHEVVDIT